MAAARSLALASLVVAAAAAAALPPYTVRLAQQEAVLVVGEQQPPPPPPPQPLLDALGAAMRQVPFWRPPPVVQGPEGPLLDRVTTTTPKPAPAATTARSEKTTKKGLLSFINAPDRPCPNGMLRDVTGQCREPW